MSDKVNKGLEGILVAESELSYIDGDAGQLIYRGYSIDDLAGQVSYEEVVYLLWHGYLPNSEGLTTFTNQMAIERQINDDVLETIRDLAATDENSMAALRTVVSSLSACDSDADTEPTDREANLRKGRRITAKIPTIIANFTRLRDGNEPVVPSRNLGHAENFLYMLNDEKPVEVLADTFDTALVLHADHGMNASTFAPVVVSSTLADLHSAIPAGIGALSGSIHGGTNQDVMVALLDLDESRKQPVQWIIDKLNAGERIPGFSHRVYNVKDPCARILSEKSKALGEAAGSLK